MRHSIAALILAACTTSAFAATPDADIDRFTNATVQLLPLGRIFDKVAAQDPKWPAQAKPTAVNDEQLACLRTELSSEGYRRSKRAEVVAYAKDHPSSFKDDLATLEAAAPVFGRLVMAGAGEGTQTADEIMKSAQGDQLLALMRLVSDPSTAELRKVAGIAGAFDIRKSENENKAAGEQLGASLAVQAMLKATITCKVPPGAFL